MSTIRVQPAEKTRKADPNPLHIFTIDLECWHQLTNQYNGFETGSNHAALDRQLDRILEILDQTQTSATFFILERIARQKPGLASRLVSLGHEAAIHGTAHRPFNQHTPASLREDILNCKKRIEDQTGQPVVSHRAPIFSVTKATLWALDVLVEAGIRIDSSIFPMSLGRYGIAGFPRHPGWLKTPGGNNLFEIPMSIARWAGASWPVSGGGYARFLPGAILIRAAQRLEKEGLPLVLYFHPYEFDPRSLVADDQISIIKRIALFLRWNPARKTIANKTLKLLHAFRFGRMDQYAEPFMTDSRNNERPQKVLAHS